MDRLADTDENWGLTRLEYLQRRVSQNRARERERAIRYRNERGHFVAVVKAEANRPGDIWPLKSAIGRELGIIAVTGAERIRVKQWISTVGAPTYEAPISLPFVSIQFSGDAA